MFPNDPAFQAMPQTIVTNQQFAAFPQDLYAQGQPFAAPEQIPVAVAQEHVAQQDQQPQQPISQGFFSVSREQLEEDFLKQNQITFEGTGERPKIALSFKELSLLPEIDDVIQQNNWTAPTPIQSVAIPIALKGSDLIGIAKTGSGKTAAFVIPALIHITKQEPLKDSDGPIVLVLSPTRELAQQTSEVVDKFSGPLKIRHACVFGGAQRITQSMALSRLPHVVVATPGRLIDFMESGQCNMNRINFLVLDEADQMLDMGFEPQIRRIIGNISKKRQTMMFSATWPKEIQQLAAEFLVNPVHMIIGSKELTTNPNIKQEIVYLSELDKLSKCMEMMAKYIQCKVIVFVKTKRTADDLQRSIEDNGIRSWAIHGDKAQAQRDYVLSNFRSSRTGVLVATDVAARGLDVNDIDVVINYDFPGDIETYVHRIGRTGRGEKNGIAVTFFTDENANMAQKLTEIMKQANQEVPEWLTNLAANAPRSKSNIYSRFPGRGGLPPRNGILNRQWSEQPPTPSSNSYGDSYSYSRQSSYDSRYDMRDRGYDSGRDHGYGRGRDQGYGGYEGRYDGYGGGGYNPGYGGGYGGYPGYNNGGYPGYNQSYGSYNQNYSRGYNQYSYGGYGY